MSAVREKAALFLQKALKNTTFPMNQTWVAVAASTDSTPAPGFQYLPEVMKEYFFSQEHSFKENTVANNVLLTLSVCLSVCLVQQSFKNGKTKP